MPNMFGSDPRRRLARIGQAANRVVRRGDERGAPALRFLKAHPLGANEVYADDLVPLPALLTFGWT